MTPAGAEQAGILLVDDTEENLVALRAILEPLGEELILARSGEEALRQLLQRDVAVILLDVKMPGLSGFETAELIKQRERTKAIPIIFLTAISKDEQHVYRAYSAGAVDYLFKPFEPEILRSKVAVFIELHRKTQQLREQAKRLAAQELAAVRRESEERYRQLADAMPQIVWMADATGKAMYYNRRWYDYTGLDPGHPQGDEWVRVVHPDDLASTLDRRTDTLTSGDVFEVQYRFRAADGSYRWHLGRAVPIRAGDEVDFWVGTATDIDDQKRIEQAQDFLLRAGAELAATLDYRRALQAVAQLAVAEIADWCSIVLVDEDGAIVPVGLAHADPAKAAFARELQDRYPGGPDAAVLASVMRTRKPQLVAEITEDALAESTVDDLHLDLLRELGLRSVVSVPVIARDRAVAAITFVAAESGRRYTPGDLRLAEELARRAGLAIENAQLYREVEERAQAARVLSSVGDGVFLVDGGGRVRLWNTAAATITGLAPDDVLGRPAVEAIPGWATIEPRIPISEVGAATAESVPLDLGSRELWLSISRVALDEGTVYAFRDLTEERALEEMRQDLVATVSHELRTPLAAIYGSALTLGRDDVALEHAMRQKLLDIIVDESSRLADIVNDLLLASQLDTGTLQVSIERCDPEELARDVVEAARTHLPPNVAVRLEPPAEPLQPVAADPGQLRQVLENVVENAVKYSPEGGTVSVRLAAAGRYARFSVADEGLGIPSGERARIFEKFYRLDPDMTGGIGGTGLGLYICRELVRRVDGRIWVEPNNGRGSVFFVDIPLAETQQLPRKPAALRVSGAKKSVANRITNG